MYDYEEDIDSVPYIPEDDNRLYQLCPDCRNEGEGGCMTCWDEGIVPHDHGEVELFAGVEDEEELPF